MTARRKSFASVIVPVFQDPQGLAVTMDSLLHQDAPPESYEIIIVDNGSNDETMAVATSFADRVDRVYALQENEIQSSYAARNMGVSRARGEYLLFIDADMTAPNHYVRSVMGAFREYDYLGCDVEITICSPTRAALLNKSTGFPIARYLEKDRYAPTCCMAVRAAVLDKVGPFDPRLESGGDMEFGRRVAAAGYRQGFVPDVVLEHPARESLDALMKKARRVARGHAQISYFHGELGKDLPRMYFNPARYVLPTSPFQFRKRLDGQISLRDATALSSMGIVLAWTGLFSFLEERRRLRTEALT